ncbi:hypothetical protein [Halorubellus sp. PRR65]|uniref:hypothetical protein n=1 Tax=Halorubellus sp. PRR65 TaxID=3098148 RepID=UPI002B25E6F7|nr:hypothetical protein [Halorubellus sp. PRR65]
MALFELAQLLWPALFVLSLLQLGLAYCPPARGQVSMVVVVGLVAGGIGVLYVIQPLSAAVGVALTTIGFGAPLGLGLVSIKLLVEEG